MKKLELNQMEVLHGGGKMRNCMVDGVLVVIGAATSIWGGWAIIVGAVAHAAMEGCFD